MSALRVAIGQVDSTVGDFTGNADRIRAVVTDSVAGGADLVLFPHMVLTGYPLGDLAGSTAFQAAAESALTSVARDVPDDVVVVLGTLGTDDEGRPFPKAVVIQDGEITTHTRGDGAPEDDATGQTLTVGGFRFGVSTGTELTGAGSSPQDGALDALLVLYASPFEVGHQAARDRLRRACAGKFGVPMFAANLVGGQDDLIFDGDSCVTGRDGAVVLRCPAFREDVLFVDFDGSTPRAADPAYVEPPQSDPVGEIYEAITLGLRDYVRKNGFDKVILGLSGGIDSALVATMACDAIGAANVIAVSMPSAYSTQHSRDDAAALAKATGLDYRVQPINTLVDAVQQELALSGVAEENLQARLRGLILMAISNSEGGLVLAPGNKSELAVGYSTIYGDAVGGFAPICDVLKTMVWQLATWRNTQARHRGEPEPIPQHTITKPASAELRPGQQDSDTLPRYDELDALLHAYLGERRSAAELIAAGFAPQTVQRVMRMVAGAEWKRRQYPLGPRVTSWALDRDLHLPVTSAWQEQID